MTTPQTPIALQDDGLLTPHTEKASSPAVQEHVHLRQNSASPTPSDEERWLPLVLRPQVVGVLCGIMVLVGVGLEVALFFSNKSKGWPTTADAATSVLHYVYTYLPVVVAMLIVTVWTSMDREIMKIQPYVDLARGGASAERTVLLDYTNHPKFVVWIYQIKNKHILAVLSTIVTLLLLIVQPMAASLFTIRDTEFTSEGVEVPRFGTLGLDESWRDLRGFASAAAFVEAQARFHLGRPPYVWESWAVDEFERPSPLISNGTLSTNTAGIRTVPNCVAADSTNVRSNDNGVTVAATWSGCSLEVQIPSNSTDGNSFGVQAIANSERPELSLDLTTVAFWIVTGQNSGSDVKAAVVFCTPEMSLHNVNVVLNLANGELLNVTSLEELGETTRLTDNSEPLYGHVFNGVRFNLTDSTLPTVRQRADSISLQLSEAVYTSARNASLEAVFEDSQRLVGITNIVYRTYLALAARENFFVEDTSGTKLPADITLILKRLWLSPVAVHVLAVVLFLAGVTGAFVHYLHHQVRKGVRLYATPGTIAVAASIISNSPLQRLVKPGYSDDRLRAALKDKKFRIDEHGKVIMEGEDPEEWQEGWNPRRSVFGSMMR